MFAEILVKSFFSKQGVANSQEGIGQLLLKLYLQSVQL